MVRLLRGAVLIWGAVFATGCGEPTAVVAIEGQPAPEIAFVDVSNGGTSKLSDFHGKIVVVEFWASWCGPCQEAMDQFQTHSESHPDWGDKVVLISVSIDDTQSAAKSHLEKKGWNKTRNGWIDPQDGEKSAVVAYAGKGIPSGYIVDTDGILIAAGHPTELDVAEKVNQILKRCP